MFDLGLSQSQSAKLYQDITAVITFQLTASRKRTQRRISKKV